MVIFSKEGGFSVKFTSTDKFVLEHGFNGGSEANLTRKEVEGLSDMLKDALNTSAEELGDECR